MNVLMTGATGFVGGAALRQLIARGHSVSAVVRSAEDAQQLEALGCTAHQIDLSEMDPGFVD